MGYAICQSQPSLEDVPTRFNAFTPRMVDYEYARGDEMQR